MPKMISVARIDTSRNADPARGMAAHNDAFGQYATMLDVLRDPQDAAQFAFIFEVHDLAGLQAATRTPEGSAVMEAGGFVEQLAVYHTV